MRTIGIAIAIIIVALVLANITKPEQADHVEDTESSDSQTEEIVENQTSSDIISDFENPSSFDDREQAERVINSTQGKPASGTGSEHVVTGIVTDEYDDTLQYFATSSYNEELGENFVGVYRFNTISNRWWRMYKTTYKKNETDSTQSLHVIGKDGRNLILSIGSANSPIESCDSLWLQDQIVSINMDDAYAGFSEYEPPNELLQQEKKLQPDCLASDDE